MKNMILIFLTINFIKTIKIKGHYHNNNGKLNHHFVFFYGQKRYGFYIFPVSINFYYDKSIFLSSNIDAQGFQCTQITLCSIGINHQVFDDSFKKLISVYKSQSPLYLTASDNQQPDHEYLLLQFEYISQNQGLKNSVIGLNKDSVFLNYVQKLYFFNQYYIIFSIQDFEFNREQIMQNTNQIQLSMDMQTAINNYTFVNKADSLIFKNLSINFIGYMAVVKEAKLDLNLPSIAILPPEMYNKIINMIRNTICRNPLKCVKKEDVYSAFENQNLSFYFPKGDTDTKIKYISFSVKEIVYFDSEDTIKYHLEESKEYFDTICFGIFIFKKVQIAMQYNYRSQNFNIYFINDEFQYRHGIVIIICLAFILSIFFVYFFRQKLGPFTDKNFKSAFSIMSREGIEREYQLISNYSVIIVMLKILFLFFLLSLLSCESKDFISSTQNLVDDNQNSILGGNDDEAQQEDEPRDFRQEAKDISYQLNMVPDDYPYFEAGNRISIAKYPRYLNTKIPLKIEKSIQGVSYQNKLIDQKQKIFKKWKDLLVNKIRV